MWSHYSVCWGPDDLLLSLAYPHLSLCLLCSFLPYLALRLNTIGKGLHKL